MSFEEFQNRSRLYVIGALESDETGEFELARKEFGKKGEDFIGECYALHEAFALSLRPEKSSAALKERLMADGSRAESALKSLVKLALIARRKAPRRNGPYNSCRMNSCRNP